MDDVEEIMEDETEEEKEERVKLERLKEVQRKEEADDMKKKQSHRVCPKCKPSSDQIGLCQVGLVVHRSSWGKHNTRKHR